jgi:NAD(P)-dependent dehydrogenase (short-subunit alcohol dehydrogenase family)
MDVYLRGTMLCTHYAIAAMRARGGGAIVNIASGAGLGFGPGGVPEYAAAKAGVVRFTAVLGPLQVTTGIRVNCICPGWVNTPMTRRTLAERAPEELPGPRPTAMVEPEEVADAVVELVRDESLAGRVMVQYEGVPRRLLPIDQI